MSKTLVICSSASFYEHVAKIEDELVGLGINVVIPKSARAMKKSGDFTVRKTWYDTPNDYTLKAGFIRSHLDEVARGDMVLVVNDRKHGVDGYIGPNVLMEMSLAWYHNKPIYLLNDFPDESPFEEELKGMSPISLSGDVSRLSQYFNAVHVSE